MLSREENELLTRVGSGTPMGNTLRRYWVPACLSEELAEPDGAPVRVRLLGEDLVAFRDTAGRIVRTASPRSISGAMRRGGCAASITAGSSTWRGAASSR
jgi:hypothetical protein